MPKPVKSHEDNPKSIKYHVKRFILENKDLWPGKTVVDMPAGNGFTSRLMHAQGAKMIALDLFPEYFEVEGLQCERADIMQGLPLPDSSVDYIICQEGIEHFSDQAKAMREFNRILKPAGRLLITTPNYSNLRARLSYLLSESERFNSIMPPNEIDTVWMNRQELSPALYFGHCFLIGIQQLRFLAKVNGFGIQRRIFTRMKTTSLLLLPVFYPFIALSHAINYFKNIRKGNAAERAMRKSVYAEQIRLALNPAILVDGHLFIEFVKEMEAAEVPGNLIAQGQEFGLT